MYFSRINDYIQKSAEILSTVSGTDVVICDETGLAFGDSDLEREAGYSLTARYRSSSNVKSGFHFLERRESGKSKPQRMS